MCATFVLTMGKNPFQKNYFHTFLVGRIMAHKKISTPNPSNLFKHKKVCFV